MEIQLINAADLAYIEQATVTATARLRGRESADARTARSRYRRPWHEIDLELKRTGTWEVRLAIEGPRGQAKTVFRIDVL